MGSGDRTDNAVRMEEALHGYIAACNTGDAEAIAAFFDPGAVHYFPPGYGDPFRGGQAIGEVFARLVQASASCWSIDQILCDRGGNRAVAEWTVRRTGLVLRGAERYEFDPATDLITEIRAYLASAPASGASRLELEGFPYADRGYTMGQLDARPYPADRSRGKGHRRVPSDQRQMRAVRGLASWAALASRGKAAARA